MPPSPEIWDPSEIRWSWIVPLLVWLNPVNVWHKITARSWCWIETTNQRGSGFWCGDTYIVRIVDLGKHVRYQLAKRGDARKYQQLMRSILPQVLIVLFQGSLSSNLNYALSRAPGSQNWCSWHWTLPIWVVQVYVHLSLVGKFNMLLESICFGFWPPTTH